MKLSSTSLFASFLFTVTVGLTGCPAGGGETDSDTAGSSGGMATEDPTGGAAVDCSSYCTDILANCTGTNAQYTTMEACMGSCAAFDAGTAADMAGNTLGCRAYHTSAAKDGPDMHCTHAGPGGAGACGSNCEGFCAIATSVCGGEWPDEASCMTACMGFTDDVAYNTASSTGNTLACRLYHLMSASASAADAATHCGHTVAASSTCM